MLNSALFLLLASGCSYPGYKSVESKEEIIENIASHPGWFSRNNESLFNTLVDISGNSYSGLLVVKSVGTDNHRVVMITEFGLKIFDMEFLPGGKFILHYCMEAINKGYIVNMLRNDFMLMFMDLNSLDIDRIKDNNAGDIMIKGKAGGKTYRFFADRNTGMVNSIIRSSLTGRQVRVEFSGNGNITPYSVIIEHFKFKIRINLELVNESISSADE